jgi:hypothetical protein
MTTNYKFPKVLIIQNLSVYFSLFFSSQLPVLRAIENPDDYDIDTNLGTPIDEGDKTGM